MGQTPEHDMGHPFYLLMHGFVELGMIVTVDGRPPGRHAIDEFTPIGKLQTHAAGSQVDMGFLADIASHPGRTDLDQWEFQTQSRVLSRIGVARLHFVSGGIPSATQKRIGVAPVLGEGSAAARAQGFIDEFVAENPGARIAVIPDGPYTMLRQG